jgi:hypothetical protein
VTLKTAAKKNANSIKAVLALWRFNLNKAGLSDDFGQLWKWIRWIPSQTGHRRTPGRLEIDSAGKDKWTPSPDTAAVVAALKSSGLRLESTNFKEEVCKFVEVIIQTTFNKGVDGAVNDLVFTLDENPPPPPSVLMTTDNSYVDLASGATRRARALEALREALNSVLQESFRTDDLLAPTRQEEQRKGRRKDPAIHQRRKIVQELMTAKSDFDDPEKVKALFQELDGAKCSLPSRSGNRPRTGKFQDLQGELRQKVRGTLQRDLYRNRCDPGTE